MIPKKKKPRKLSSYQKKLVELFDEYRAAADDQEVCLVDAVRWAHQMGKLDFPMIDMIRVMPSPWRGHVAKILLRMRTASQCVVAMPLELKMVKGN